MLDRYHMHPDQTALLDEDLVDELWAYWAAKHDHQAEERRKYEAEQAKRAARYGRRGH